MSTTKITKIPMKNQKFPQKKASRSEAPPAANSAIADGRSSMKETANMTPPENPSPMANILTDGLVERKAKAAPIVVANPAKLVKIKATKIVSGVIEAD